MTVGYPANKPSWRLCVAPMMKWTDAHDRFFLRLLSPHTRLYTEMVTTGALIHGDRDRFLHFNEEEHPVALQLGGCEPGDLARCAEWAESYGFDEVNLNVGCPSDRVQNGRFGACLMAEPDRVADCVAAMRARARLPVTVKTRIGIDHLDAYEHLSRFVEQVMSGGCETLIVHARKAWLKGLSPRENREVPPLRYDVVHRLKVDFPALTVVINGGVTDLDHAAQHLERVDGVMLGRAAYHNPYLLAAADARLFGDTAPAPTRHDVVRALLPYVARECARGVPLKSITRHVFGLFQGQPGARAWRRHLSERAHRSGAGPEVLERALALMPEHEAAERRAVA